MRRDNGERGREKKGKQTPEGWEYIEGKSVF